MRRFLTISLMLTVLPFGLAHAADGGLAPKSERGLSAGRSATTGSPPADTKRGMIAPKADGGVKSERGMTPEGSAKIEGQKP